MWEFFVGVVLFYYGNFLVLFEFIVIGLKVGGYMIIGLGGWQYVVIQLFVVGQMYWIDMNIGWLYFNGVLQLGVVLQVWMWVILLGMLVIYIIMGGIGLMIVCVFDMFLQEVVYVGGVDL